MRSFSFFASLSLLSLAACGGGQEEELSPQSEQIPAVVHFIPTNDLISASENCRNPRSTRDLVVMMPTHSKEGRWLREQGCVTIAQYETNVESAYIERGGDRKEVVHHHKLNDILIHRTDLSDRGKSVAAVLQMVATR